MDPSDVATLSDSIDERYRALVLTGAYCGLRFGELAGLRRDRVDLLRRRIDVAEVATEVRGEIHAGPPKTNPGRRLVPVPRLVAGALEQHLGTTAGDLVFPAPEGGTLRASLFRGRFWQPGCCAADLSEMVPSDESKPDERKRYIGLRIHDLRHTAVALWIAAGASPKELAARAGHTSVVTVFDRYGHLLPGHEDRVNDALDAMARYARPNENASVRAIDGPKTQAAAPERAAEVVDLTGRYSNQADLVGLVQTLEDQPDPYDSNQH